MKEQMTQSVLSDVDVSAVVVGLFCEILGVEPSSIDEKELLASYGVNSVDLIDVVVKLETRFGIQFDPEKMTDLSCRKFTDNIQAALAAG